MKRGKSDQYMDQPALDMADHALEYLSINSCKWTKAEREAFGRELLKYAAMQLVHEELQS